MHPAIHALDKDFGTHITEHVYIFKVPGNLQYSYIFGAGAELEIPQQWIGKP